MNEESNTLCKLRRYRGKFRQWFVRKKLEKLKIAFAFDDIELKKEAIKHLMHGCRIPPRQFLIYYAFTDEELTDITDLPADKARQEIRSLVDSINEDSSFDKFFIWMWWGQRLAWVYLVGATLLCIILHIISVPLKSGFVVVTN